LAATDGFSSTFPLAAALAVLAEASLAAESAAKEEKKEAAV
jgi:hypothetical protein